MTDFIVSLRRLRGHPSRSSVGVVLTGYRRRGATGGNGDASISRMRSRKTSTSTSFLAALERLFRRPT